MTDRNSVRKTPVLKYWHRNKPLIKKCTDQVFLIFWGKKNPKQHQQQEHGSNNCCFLQWHPERNTNKLKAQPPTDELPWKDYAELRARWAIYRCVSAQTGLGGKQQTARQPRNACEQDVHCRHTSSKRTSIPSAIPHASGSAGVVRSSTQHQTRERRM